jgi:hypothetical protein
MESIKKFPRGISDQVISSRVDVATSSARRAPGPGLQQAIEETVPHNDIEEASSHKRQATSSQASSGKHQALSYKRQASSRKRQAHESSSPHKVSSHKHQGS